MNNFSLGRLGEERAVSFLEEKSYFVLDRNYRFLRAEVDIVAATSSEIVFVEVKTRRTKSYGEPEDSINDNKKRQLFKVAEAWLHERKMEGSPVRFDVISIMNPDTEGEIIHHLEGAFWYI